MRLIAPPLLAIVVLPLGLGCNGGPPTPSDCRQNGCPPGYDCLDVGTGYYQCVPRVPPEDQQCHLIGAQKLCYDNPPEGESFPEWAPNWGYVCDDLTRAGLPEQCSVSPPDPDPDPDPDPTEGCVFPQGIPDGEFTQGAVLRQHADVINATMADMTGCSIGSDCPTGMEPDEWMHAVIDRLRQQGLCAGRHRDVTPGGTDEIAVTGDCTSWWESSKVYNYGGGKVIWHPGAARPAYKIPAHYCSGEEPPEPTVCASPVPPPLHHFRGPAERDCRPGQCCDATPYVCDQSYCAEVGFTDGRVCCAVRPDGAPDRVACEHYLMDPPDGGEAKWSADTATSLCNGNHLRARCVGCTWMKVCEVSGSICNVKVF